MRYRLMAIYEGAPFEAGIGPAQGDIVLFAACPPPEDLGFEPATGHWRKQLRVSDVRAIWESRPVGRFRGERCMVLDDLGDRLHIGYLGHDGFKAEELGYWQVDRGVYELVAPRPEVTDILEERIDYPRRAADPVTGPQAAVAPDNPAPPPMPVRSSGQHQIPADYRPGGSGQYQIPAGYAPGGGGGVTLPVPAAAPLPLEAEALMAASARRARPSSRRAASARAAGSPPSAPSPAPPPPAPGLPPAPGGPAAPLASAARLAALAELAGIPAAAFAVGGVVDGAMCLVQSEQGFEVFHAGAGSRQARQVFTTEEAAAFYMFGVLAADALRSGSLARVPASQSTGQPLPA